MSRYDQVQKKVQEVKHKMLAVGLAELAALMVLLSEEQKRNLDKIMSCREMDLDAILQAVRLSTSTVMSNLDNMEKIFFSIR